MNKKGGFIADIILIVVGFIVGYLYGDFIINLIKSLWIKIF